MKSLCGSCNAKSRFSLSEGRQHQLWPLGSRAPVKKSNYLETTLLSEAQAAQPLTSVPAAFSTSTAQLSPTDMTPERFKKKKMLFEGTRF